MPFIVLVLLIYVHAAASLFFMVASLLFFFHLYFYTKFWWMTFIVLNEKPHFYVVIAGIYQFVTQQLVGINCSACKRVWSSILPLSYYTINVDKVQQCSVFNQWFNHFCDRGIPSKTTHWISFPKNLRSIISSFWKWELTWMFPQSHRGFCPF